MSTLRLNSNDRLRGNANPMGIARTTEAYDLVFDIWSESNNCAAANLLPGGGRKIWGVIYEIPEMLIARKAKGACRSLDEIEGEGIIYSRQEITIIDIKNELRHRPVLTYFGLHHQKGIKTSGDYVKHILHGLREHNIPEGYIEYVKEQIITNNPNLELFIETL